MAKTSNDRKTPFGQRKAGKGRKPFTSPPAVNEDKLDRSILGEKQFIARTQQTVTVFGRDGKPRALPVPYSWDANRKQIVFSPGKSA